MLLAILADDLTGAADAGAAFATAGVRTSIMMGNLPAEHVDVVAQSTESRGADPAMAAALNAQAALNLMCQPDSRRPRWVYKKIDSALRGHPRQELLAIMAELGTTRALIAPALPAEGRTTVGSRQFLNGVPLEDTPLGSRRQSDLVTLFGQEEEVPVQSLELETVRQGHDEIERVLQRLTSGLLIADAETDSDLEAIARAALDSDLRILSGSAGLARQVARVLAMTSAASEGDGHDRMSGPVLIVAGSRNSATVEQVDFLEHAGFPIVRPSQRCLGDTSASIDAVTRELVAHLSSGRSTVLTTVGLASSHLGSSTVVARIADIVTAPAVRECVGGLVLTGGDVAASILRAMEVRELHLKGEVRPAIPWGVAECVGLHRVPVVTKAGSFGSQDALFACFQRLTEP